MKIRFGAMALCIAVVAGAWMVCEAGIRSPGEYCGIVIFDRWDGCTLYSGIYVMYISEKVKEGLRKYAGQPVQIDAKEVSQPENPGDGLIGKFEYLGKAPADRNWVKAEGLHLESSITVGKDGKAIATITIENKGADAVKLFSQELAFTLLVKKNGKEGILGVSDGPSFALITRQSFEIGTDEPRWKGEGIAWGTTYSWTIGKENALPHEFTIESKARKEIRIAFDLPDGEYDFLCGYGGGVHEGQCVASNLSAFDVKEGKTKVVEIKSR